jgi:hypothetical protein
MVNGTLYVQFNAGTKRRLIPTVADVFIPETGEWDNMLLKFSRDGSGRVAGVDLEFDRVKQLRFVKKGVTKD